jgi:catechol 2,3-dioxygenase-like lactoylglutathione lyase family enzyme
MGATMQTESLATPTETSHTLINSRMVDLIVFVKDLQESRDFYERLLGLHVLSADTSAVRFDAGPVMLSLRLASEHGIQLAPQRDDSSDTVFLVEDIIGMRTALEARGVVFARRRSYEIGSVVDFYDPNGHRLMLYEPSLKSLASSSGPKVRAVWAATGRGRPDLIGAPLWLSSSTPEELERSGLDGKPLLYFFVFVKDAQKALDFYASALALKSIEQTHCCSDTCPGETKGVVKYDSGGVILSTHHLHGEHVVVDDDGIPYGARDFAPGLAQGVAPVFHVSNIEESVRELTSRGVQFHQKITATSAGRTAAFLAPSGHLYYLYEPSDEALTGADGEKLTRLLAMQF